MAARVGVSGAVDPRVQDLLDEVGIPLGSKTPRTATSELIARATRVVTFGCLDSCPIGAKDKAEDWPIPGATGKTMDQLRGIRDELQRRVKDLASRLPPSSAVPKAGVRKG